MVEREGEVEQVVSEHFDEDIEGIEQSEAGVSHSTYFVELEDREVVVKISESDWQPLPDFEKGFENDAPIMKEVRRESEVPVPEVYAFDNSENEFDFKYLVSEKIEGRNISDFSGGVYLSIVSDLGRVMRQLHEGLEYEKSGELSYDGHELEVEEQGWSSMFREMVWTLTGHLDSEYEEFKPRIRKIVEQNLHLAEFSGRFSLVHQEMKGDNVIATESRIKGIIDWERAFSGDPEYDLFATEVQLSQKITDDEAGLREDAGELKNTLREAYTEERELREGWRKRRYLYYLPFIAQMMWVMEDREGKYETLSRQIEEIEAVLG